MPSYERFMVFAFRDGAQGGGMRDFVVTATLDAGELLESLAWRLNEEGVDPGRVDTVQLVSAGLGAMGVFMPPGCREFRVRGVTADTRDFAAANLSEVEPEPAG